MPRKLRELRAGLWRAGATVVDQEGSHEKWAHPLAPDYQIILAGKDGDDAKHYQERQVRALLSRIASEAQAREQEE